MFAKHTLKDLFFKFYVQQLDYKISQGLEKLHCVAIKNHLEMIFDLTLLFNSILKGRGDNLNNISDF